MMEYNKSKNLDV